ncbi:UDP-N-acetylglucosamine--dolichyl-phosphate N-acetylglucosaminephosphotransferase [Pyrofollis japonicus]|uniref:MraY family glycosyltransferase n=1 Tax=Pyrofollis japonicus TaxID=3060460 RepID=UPI00295B350B|nr:glycosyltransferase 4 family protein [Pyrofollis japonicus]BEP18312.1 UDP-N-acetylglucosamine--dolichyl-phosphate N-acetylglucosaminephosphotransferase [Pyrofollis japonicus]
MNSADIVYAVTSSIVAFAIVVAVEPAWIRAAHERGLVGKDMNKPGDVKVAEAGGVWAIVAAAFGLLVLEALYTYLSNSMYYPAELYALVSLLLLATFIGFLDDILGWKKGLPRWARIVFMAPVALPLVVIKAGKSTLALPLIGVVDLGLAYPLLAVPIGVLGAANAFNMLAGYNGLEAGMGILLMLFTSIYAYMKGLVFIVQAALIMMMTLLGFLLYNWYPARVFPGNALTYGVGAYYAALVVLGNMEKFGVSLFTLYFIEFMLFLRGLRNGVYKENFGIPREDGSLIEPYDKVYSLTHFAIRVLRRLRGRAREPEVTVILLLLQTTIGVILICLSVAGLL